MADLSEDLLPSLERQRENLRERKDRLYNRIHELNLRLHPPGNDDWVFRYRSSGKKQADENDASLLQTLEKELQEVEERFLAVHNQIETIIDITIKKEWENHVVNRAPQIKDIYFVNELERADQYFDLIEYLRPMRDEIEKHKYDHVAIYHNLVTAQTRKAFDKLDEDLLRRAATAVHLELQFEKLKKVNSEMEKSKHPAFPLLSPGEEYVDPYVASYPIARLVLETRQEHNELDPNLGEERKKILELDPQFHDCVVMVDGPEEEFKKIMSTYEGMADEELYNIIRNKLIRDADARYKAFREKYSKQTDEINSVGKKRPFSATIPISAS